LKEVWDDGTFSGSYQSFRNEIVDRMPSDQTPNFFRVGQVAPLFEQQTPFTI
jgi:metacaspase-1